VRKFFVPYPDVNSFEELNQYLHAECAKLLEQNPKWEAEKAALRPLAPVRFDAPGIKKQPSIDIPWFSLKQTAILYQQAM
jgi:hypothetical protein